MKILNSAKFWDYNLKNSSNLISKSSIYQHKLQIVLKNIINRKGNLLDVGIGYGFIEELIIKNNVRLNLYGVDISKYSITNAQKKFKGQFAIGNISKIPFNTIRFDCILLLDILEHLTPQNVVKSLCKLNHLLNPDGLVVISVPINESSGDSKLNHHLQKYDLEKIKNQLRMSGFLVAKKYYLTAFNNNYLIKSFVNSIFNIRKPNLLILVCKKK